MSTYELATNRTAPGEGNFAAIRSTDIKTANRKPHRTLLFLVILVILVMWLAPTPASSSLDAAETPKGQEDTAFERSIRPYLTQYCLECHGPKQQKADLRLDQLDPDMVNGSDADMWQEVLDLTNVSEMPPRVRHNPVRKNARG